MGKIFVLLGLTLGAQAFAVSDPVHVFGTDDRKPMLSAEYPWSAVGRLISQKGACTATLIGYDLIVTAAHCIFEEDTGREKANIRFYPNYKNGSSKDSAGVKYAWWGTRKTENQAISRSHDWALIRLDKPLGKTYGYLGIWNTRFDFDIELTLAGYSGDFKGGSTAGVHEKCHIRSENKVGYLHHDCDSNPGASGGPLFFHGKTPDETRIVAIHVASYKVERKDGDEYQTGHANISIPVSLFRDLAISLRSSSVPKDL